MTRIGITRSSLNISSLGGNRVSHCKQDALKERNFGDIAAEMGILLGKRYEHARTPACYCALENGSSGASLKEAHSYCHLERGTLVSRHSLSQQNLKPTTNCCRSVSYQLLSSRAVSGLFGPPDDVREERDSLLAHCQLSVLDILFQSRQRSTEQFPLIV